MSDHDIKEILEQRGNSYGDFNENARISQKTKSLYRKCINWKNLTRAQQEALDMIAIKVARILTGAHDSVDEWLDIQGYANLASNNTEVNLVRAAIKYDPETGKFFRRMNKFTPRLEGKETGFLGLNGYVYIHAGGKTWSAGRLAYFIMEGKRPPELIDHKDGDTTNNKWSNLRPANLSQNASNQRKAPPLSGYRGVSMFKPTGAFRAKCKGKYAYFKTAKEAALWYNKIALETYGEFATLNVVEE